MGRARCSSSSSALKVENVFEELISKITPVDFDPPPFMKMNTWELDHYIAIKRNEYLTKRRVDDYGFFCSCTPSGSSVDCDKDCQCGMMFACCSSNCSCGNKCANKSFQHRHLKKTKLVRTEKYGTGLVTAEEIKKGEFVIEYVGEERL